MHTRPRLLFGSLAALFAAAAFGVNAPFSVVAYDRGLTPFGLVVWRAAIASFALACFLAVLAARGRPLVLHRLDRRSAALLTGAGLVGALLNVAIFAAFERISVALGLITFYTYPAMLAAVGLAFHGERMTPAKLIALVLSIGGMALVVLGQVDPGTGLRIDLLGLGLAFTAALCQVAYFTIGRIGFRHVPAEQATLGVFVVAVVAYAVLGLAASALGAVTPALRDPGLFAVVVLLGIVGAAIPSILVLTGIRTIGGTRTGILLLFEPAVGVGIAAVLLGQAITAVQVLGGTLVLGGSVLLQAAPDPGDHVSAVPREDEPAPTFE